ncbi:MAG TPA: hypothetical protein VEB40_12090 [Flavipsychrobacter sp.]|nr:hypothetical protein [Flavipsychrobacter sp.]
MKQFFSFVLVLACAQAYAQKNDLEKYALSGKVKSLKETNTTEYTERGKRVQSTTVISYRFNGDGNLTEMITLIDNSNKRAMMIDTFNMDMERMPVENIERRVVYTYDDRGKLIKEEEYITPRLSTATKVVEYTYNENGEKTMALHYNPAEEHGAKSVEHISYNPKGKPAERSITKAEKDSGFEEQEREQYVYDENGRMIEKFYYNKELRSYWRDMSVVYDDKGHAIEYKMYMPDGEIWQTKTVQRNKRGDIIELVASQQEGGKYTEHYSYENEDRHGNYLRKITSAKGKMYFGQDPVTTAVRTIEYY